MDIETWLAFCVASTIMLIIPGPTILTVISYSITHGYKAKLPMVIAVALGDSTALTFSMLGLGALMAKSLFWFQVVKWIGGLYLLYLGFKLLKAGLDESAFEQDDKQVSSRTLFINTYLVTALNPKSIVFFVAFLPLFITNGPDVTQQLWVLAVTFVALATMTSTLYAVFAGKARQLLSSQRTQRLFNFTGGGLLSAAGIWALSVRQS